MIISLNWLKKFTRVDLPIDELATLIGARLVEIEETIDLGEKYKGIVVVKVKECKPLEGTDHLSLTRVDDGGVVKDVKRDGDGFVQVICGAPNAKEGMLAVWLPPGSTVPSSFSGAEPFVLSAKDLRGTISNGMLASPKELDLFDEHDGILEVDKDVKPGTDFASVYGLDDYLLDIENKSLTHRPDAFGIIGFAREVAAVQGQSFITPDWLAEIDPVYEDKTEGVINPTVSIDNPELSERYQVVVLSDADSSRKSPVEIQTYLARVGVRPINAVVDVTNYLMMLTGQPLHAFDYDKVLKLSEGKPEIHVRGGKAGEELELLDGRSVKLAGEDIVISAGETAIGLAGAMGGVNTAIDGSTKNIILESATFNLFNLRGTQMRHGIFTEAITRFTKGQPAELGSPVLAEAVRLLGKWSGAKRVSDVALAKGDKAPLEAITVTSGKVNKVLGTDYNIAEIEAILRSAEFASAKTHSETITVSPPYWRSDVHQIEDIAEEVGRLKGFDSITPTLPERDFTAVSPSEFDKFRMDMRRNLVRAGGNEVLSYSFVHGDVLTKSDQKVEDSYKLTNSLSPDLQYYRQSLTPSLLQAVYPNIKNGFDDFALFEINKTHPKQRGITNEKVPDEADSLALVITAKNQKEGAAYYRAKAILDYVCSLAGIELEYSVIGKEVDYPTAKPFEHQRSAIVVDKGSKEPIGMLGEYKRSVVKNYKLPEYTAGFELDLSTVFMAVKSTKLKYSPLSRYPSTERDICFQVESGVRYDQVIDAINSALSIKKLESLVSPIDIYQPEGGTTKNITVRVRFNSHSHTMTGEETSKIVSNIINLVTSTLGATVI